MMMANFFASVPGAPSGLPAGASPALQAGTFVPMQSGRPPRPGGKMPPESMYSRARYKYPAQEAKPLDLSEVPMNLPPIPSDTPGSASRFKGVTKSGKKWKAQIRIPSEGGLVHLGTFDSEEDAGIIYARARYNKYLLQQAAR